MKNENLSIYYIDKKSYKSVEAHRKYCIMRLESRQNGLSKTLPPIFFRDINELDKEELLLLENFCNVFCKGMEATF